MMNCSEIAKNLQAYLDDLLQEDDFQAMRAHLNGCSKCRDHVRSVGSLASAVRTLGEIEVPEDLGQSILFRLRQNPKPSGPKRRAASRYPGNNTALLFAVIGLSWVAGYAYMKSNKGAPSETEPPVVMRTEIQRAPVSDLDASAAFAQLQMMAAALGVDKEIPPEGDEWREAPTVSEAVDASAVLSREMHPEMLGSAHWHVSYTAEPERLQLLNALRILGVGRDYESVELVVVSASAQEARRILYSMERIFPGQVSGPGVGEGVAALPEGRTRCSIYLSRGNTEGLGVAHWHLRLRGTAREELFEVIRELGILIDYQSTHLLVLTVPQVELGTLVNRINGMPGVVPDAGPLEASRVRLSAGTARVSIYLIEE